MAWPDGDVAPASGAAGGVVAGADDAWLAGIVLSSHDAIVGEALDGTVTTWNAAAERLYGHGAAEIVGRHADVLYAPEDRADEVSVRARIARGEPVEAYTAGRVRRDGSTVTVSVRASPVLDRAGHVVGIATISRPAGSAGIGPDAGHRLRTPLQVIIGFTGTLLMRLPGPLTDEQERQLELVQASAEQLLTLVNRLTAPPGR